MAANNLRRLSSDRWLLGVCSGLAERFDIEPVLVRAAFLGLAFFHVPIIAYLFLGLALPDENGEMAFARAREYLTNLTRGGRAQ
ncbi:PspC domain-containing protein [Candidatus Hydrogenedentota bacterium]